MGYVSEEESYIREIIELRKHFSPIPQSEPQFSPSPVLSSSRKTSNCEGGSFNSNSTAFSSTSDYKSLNRVMRILKATCLQGPDNEKTLKSVAELLEKSPEPYFTLILDEACTVKGLYYIEISTEYLHHVLSTADLPIIIPQRRIKSYLLFDTQTERFISSTSSKYDAVLLDKC